VNDSCATLQGKMKRFLWFWLAATALAQERDLGPKPGEAFPEFALRDQHGKVRSLASVLGPQGGVIVFFRSADW
jgi:hypothetical protein